MNPILISVLSILAGGIVIGIPTFFLGAHYRKRLSEAEIGSAEDEAKRILNEAIKDAQSVKKEAQLEAKDEIYKARAEAEAEMKSRRGELQRQENRLASKEENLDKKTNQIEKKEEQLQNKLKQAEARLDEANRTYEKQMETLERISGMTKDQAKEQLLGHLENELNHEKALKIRSYEQQLHEESEETARDIISQAIQRCASDHVTEATVSVVTLPSDEMKGRIIGREGRNIRALETITGVDLIIDDTPEAITLSSFDPVRRAVAKGTLEKLIVDGRIHPTRIEEMYEKSKKEIDQKMKLEGERAVMELGIHGIHPELVKLIGRLQFRTSYGQNVLDHSVEVANIAGIMAAEVGADVAMAKRAGLLHDIGKGLDHEMDGTHIQIGVDMARKYKENKEVIHAIEAHHGEVEATTVVACLVQAADAISAARPGARRENIENYIKRLEKLEGIASSFPGVEKTFAVQAGREIRIMVNPVSISDDEMTLLARAIVKKIEDEMEYPGQIKVHIIRENRAVEYAK